MTEMLQKTENVAKNVANENSQDLTEQWKKGKLPSGWYYVRLIRGEYRIDLYINGKNEWIDCPDNIIDTIVCEVPSYEEWRNMVNCACEEHEANKRLLEENAQLKERISKLEKMQYSYTPEEWNTMLHTVNRTSEQNAQLKELLKECRLAIFDYPPYDLASDKIRLMNKIDEVLK